MVSNYTSVGLLGSLYLYLISMKKEKTLYQPTVRGSASICSWTLKFRFLTREQCLKFINLYLKEFEYSDNITYEMVVGDSVTKNEHWVTIEDVIWANNLTRVGKLLEKCDYEFE